MKIKNLIFMPWSVLYKQLLLLTNPPRANWNHMREDSSGAINFSAKDLSPVCSRSCFS